MHGVAVGMDPRNPQAGTWPAFARTVLTMIDAALKFVSEQVNAHLQKRAGADAGVASVGPLVDDKGSWLQPRDTLRLTLFQVDEERVLRDPLPTHVMVAGREVSQPPPLKLNLVVVFAAHFQHYDQSLRCLSLVMTLFQARPLYTASDMPSLPAGLERLAVELVSYGPEQLNQMWACIGAKQLPSVVYRLRLVELRDSEPLATGAPITSIATRVGGR